MENIQRVLIGYGLSWAFISYFVVKIDNLRLLTGETMNSNIASVPKLKGMENYDKCGARYERKWRINAFSMFFINGRFS